MRTLTLTADEETYGVKYKAIPDSKAIGLKFRKDAAKIRGGLGKLTSDQVRVFLDTQKLDVEGFTLSHEEVSVTRYFDDSKSKWEANSDKNVLILLDVEVDESLAKEGLAREWCNRVQRLRKKVGLNPTDDLDIYYRFIEDMGDQLKEMLVSQKDFLVKNLKTSPRHETERPAGTVILGNEEQEVSNDLPLRTFLTCTRLMDPSST